MMLSRRELLTGTAALAAAAALPGTKAHAQSSFLPLKAVSRSIEVKGKAAKVFGIEGADKANFVRGGRFSVSLENGLREPTLLHWHGLTPPAALDGTHLAQDPIKPGNRFEYDFELKRAGTHWMHSHVGLQEQLLLAAPLIVHDVDDLALGEQDVVMMLHDFTFRDPADILEELKTGHSGMMGKLMGAMGMGGKPHKMHNMAGMANMAGMQGMAMLNDVAYDAWLANDRTLADPEVVQVEAGGRVRLRVINGCAASNMLIDLGSLTGEIIALDGNPIEPLKGSTFALAIAQRADIRIALPGGRGAWPILARPEGLPNRTGIILASPGARIDAVDETGDPTPGVTDFALESRPRPVIGLVDRPADMAQVMDLGGDDMSYRWNINGVTDPHGVLMKIKSGQRVEITLRNQTMMAHPMHLHGHHFQIVGVGAARFSGPMRDTVLVPAGERVTIAFDADNPGLWAFHCHHMYHMNAGMMAAIAYEGAA